MKLQRGKILKAIIDEKDKFAYFVDYINEHGTGGEILKIHYLWFYEHLIMRDIVAIDKEKAFYKYAFDSDSMIENGFLYNISDEGKFAFSKIVMDVLKFIDTSRSKQLFSDEFENMRQSTRMYRDNILKFEIGSEEQLEFIAGLRNLLNEILSKVSENALILRIKVEAFSKEYIRHEENISNLSSTDLYNQVNDLYYRNVKPFMDFTTTENIVAGGGFYAAMQNVIDYFDDNSDLEKSSSFALRRDAITSYYKDITETAEILQHYLDQLGKDHSFYLVIENAFSELMERVEPLRTGGSKYILLSPNDPFFKKLSVFDGLKAFHYEQKLSLDDSGNYDRFVWHLERVQDRPPQKRVKLQAAIPLKNQVWKKRQKLISELVYEINISERIDDITLNLHKYLNNQLLDYTLLDFLVGLEAFLPRLRKGITCTDHHGRIEDDIYYFEYIVKTYEGKK